MRTSLLQVAVLVALVRIPYTNGDALAQQQHVACATPQKTLSFACDGVCSDVFTPCVLLTTTASSSSSACSYKCYDEIYVSPAAERGASLVLLVPFGSWKSPQKLASVAETPLASPAIASLDDVKNYATISNDQLSTIDTLKLRSTTSAV